MSFQAHAFMQATVAGIGPLQAEGPWMAFSSGYDFWNFQALGLGTS